MDRPSKKYTLLIIEDDLAILMALGDKFSHEGFNVITAKNGEEGLAMALAGQPDLILLDIIMPVMDGVTTLKKLRKDEWGKDVPVIILTNLGDDKQVSQSMEEGVYDYLIKTDWSLDDVVKKVKERLGV